MNFIDINLNSKTTRYFYSDLNYYIAEENKKASQIHYIDYQHLELLSFINKINNGSMERFEVMNFIADWIRRNVPC